MRDKYIKKLLLKSLRLFLSSKNRSLKKALSSPNDEQSALLTKMIKLYAETNYAKNYHLKSSDNYEEFSQKIPLSLYEDLQKDIRKDKENYNKAILPLPPVKWEYTSGSSSVKKLIPYSKDTMKSFEKGLFYWLGNLINNYSFFNTGKIFYSISPSNKLQDEGVQDDSEYLPPFLNKYLGDYLLNPQKIKRIKDPKQFRIALIAYLLNQRDLETFFIWSPTYLLSLIKELEKNKELIFQILNEGQYQCSNITIHYDFSLERIKEIEDNWENYSKIWPELKFISCWTQASAKFFIEQLETLFPQCMIQGKGLIATEGIFTIPIVESQGSVPALKETFFEFIDSNDQVLRLHELKDGNTYTLVVTNLSGLIRYNIQDKVLVTGFYKKTPVLEFVGRGKYVSDLTGEKLSDTLIEPLIKNLLDKDSCAFIYPTLGPIPHYTCITDSKSPSFNTDLEKALCTAVHYSESRRLAQLEAIKVIRVEDAQECYFNHFLEKGMNYGDIKFSCLLTDFEYSEDKKR